MSTMTRERMNEIITECDKYEIKLANDPTILGPKYLQDMIASCRNYTNHVTRLLNEVHRGRINLDLDLRRKQTAFKIQADELLAKDMVVRNLPNIKDRESQINLMLRDEHREISNLSNDILDLEHIEEYVKRRHRELKDTMREIQAQRSLILDEYQTGSMYGDERPTVMGADSTAYTPGSHASPEGMDEEDIEKMLLDAEAQNQPVVTQEQPAVAQEQHTETGGSEPQKSASVIENVVTPAQTEEATTLAALSEEDEIRAFLDQTPEAVSSVTHVPVPTPNTAEDDFSEMLNNL
jgi:hypothetical protein